MEYKINKIKKLKFKIVLKNTFNFSKMSQIFVYEYFTRHYDFSYKFKIN